MNRITFIGGGNMARSLIGGLRSGDDAPEVAVVEPREEARRTLHEAFGASTHAELAPALEDASTLVLAVKPQVMGQVCRDLGSVLGERRPLLISIAAGIRMDQIAQWTGCNTAQVRCMPNTPALIGAGASGLCANELADDTQRARAERILRSAGEVVWVHEEKLMDTVTALSGSGPAYFFLFVEAMQDAAIAQGMDREAARLLATQTCLGAGRMLRESGESAAELRRRVTSPGGTTQAALECFQAQGLGDLVKAAMDAARRRGAELSQELQD